MPRALRIEYPGAIYHVMNRGDRREPIFRDDLDHEKFLATLAGAELAGRAKGDTRKIRIAQRLRAETAVTLKWIATELHMGKWTHVANCLQTAKGKSEPTNQSEFNLCQK